MQGSPIEFSKRSVAVAAFVVGGLVGMAGGCAKGVASLEGPGVSPAVVQASASHAGGVGGSAKVQRSDLRARTLGRIGSVGSFLGANAGGSESGRTPTVLEQLMPEEDRPVAGGLCPPEMASIDDRFCVDRFEESLVEMLPNGDERGFSPYAALNGELVRAVSVPHVVPQAYISGTDAGAACARSGKRLCKPAEWQTACMGPKKTTYGYGNERESRRCNDHGRSAMGALYGFGAPGDRAFWSMDRMNNPMLNQVQGTLAKTGDHEACTNDYGVYDMVGNLHEWVADPNGTFQGGYYLDTQQNGDGCTYKTKAHEIWYHDYSTGFRCCADVAP